MAASWTSLPDRAARYVVPRELRSESLVETIRFLRSSVDHAQTSGIRYNSPIFLLSAGWRSGSTLLQRLVCSDGSTLIWGEPFGDRIPVCRLASTLQGLKADDAHFRYSIDNLTGEFSQQWIANMNPGVSALYAAHLSYFEQMFAETAFKRKFHRWGAKWVRLTGYHAWYLKWLYPKAKLVFLVRHPLRAYHSYKRKRWYTIRPDYQAKGVVRFMAHWTYLAESFVSEKDTLGALLVRYEDLITDGQVVEQLERHLEIPLRREILSRRVGARDKDRLRVRWWERMICRLLTSHACAALDYDVC